MSFLVNATVGLAIVNVLLLIALIYVYAKNAFVVPTLFATGLLGFAVLFLIQNGMYLYFCVTMMSFYAQGHEVFAFVFTLLQTGAFGILNYLSWK